MSETLESAASTTRIDAPPGPALWRAAGVLAIAHVVLVFAGFALQRSASLGGSLADYRRALTEGGLGRIMTGEYIEALAFLLLLPVLAFTALAIGRRSPLARWASQTSLLAGVTYVAVTLATAMAAGAAAHYAGRHGGDLHTLVVVNEVRLFAYYASLFVLAVQAIGLGVAARSDRFSPRWVGLGGIVVGVLLAVGVAGAGIGLHDLASMLWMIWWVGVGVMMFRTPVGGAGDARR
jgi:hypothetical protein